MSFTCFDKFKGVLDSIPDDGDRAAMALAIVEYGLTGAEPGFSYPMSAIFEGMREDIDNSRDARNSNKGGRPRGSRNKPKAATSPEVSEEVSENQENGGSRNEKPPFPVSETPVSETGNPGQAKPGQAKPGQGNPLPPSADGGTFAMRCLAALNEELGTPFTRMPEECGRMLADAEDRFGVGQVRAMVAYKRDEVAGTRFKGILTPNTLFSPKHFEQYMAQSMAHAEEAGRYAEYD